MAELPKKFYIDLKKSGLQNKQAIIAIQTASLAAAGIGASPIPFTDATLLIPTQTAMIVAIYRAYGRSISEGAVKGVLSSLATTTIARGVVGNVIKFIPGIGTITGGIINTGVAVAFTQTMGLAIAERLEAGELEEPAQLKDIILSILHFRRSK